MTDIGLLACGILALLTTIVSLAGLAVLLKWKEIKYEIRQAHLCSKILWPGMEVRPAARCHWLRLEDGRIAEKSAQWNGQAVFTVDTI
jgi:hypothetical protein